MRLLMLDNYDSFTYNLVHRLGELGAHCVVVRNDQMSAEDMLLHDVQGIVISPGPCSPTEAGVALDLVKKAPNEMPILGVCLGHQTLAMAYGATLQQDSPPVHGKVAQVKHMGKNLFARCPDPFFVTRYHSLSILPHSLPSCFQIDAMDGSIIMSITHKELPRYGLQFHPESIRSPDGYTLLENFISQCRGGS